VGRWAGYLLLQHKEKLGGNRFISKVRLFKPAGASLPYLVFYVNDPSVSAARSLPLSNMGDIDSLRVVKKSADGKNVIREHVLPLVSSFRNGQTTSSDAMDEERGNVTKRQSSR
jgi:hypothetical protein